MASRHNAFHLASSLFLLLACGVAAIPLSARAQTAPVIWTTSGDVRTNSRNQPSETIISRSTAQNLTVKWRFTTGGYVSATPTVDATAVYFLIQPETFMRWIGPREHRYGRTGSRTTPASPGEPRA